MCAIDDCDPPDLYTRAIRKSRKARPCDECGRQIATDEAYSAASILGEGYWSHFATCQHCMIGEEWLRQNCGGVVHAGVRDDLTEHIDEYRSLLTRTMGRVVVGMRRRWQRFDGAGLMPVPKMPPAIEVR